MMGADLKVVLFSVEERILMDVGQIMSSRFLCEHCRKKSITDSDEWWVEARAAIRQILKDYKEVESCTIGN